MTSPPASERSAPPRPPTASRSTFAPETGAGNPGRPAPAAASRLAARPQSELQFDFGAAIKLLLYRWKWIAVAMCVAMVLGFLVTLVSPVEYQSAVELLPSSPRDGLGAMAGLGAAAGLASTFGFNLGAPSMMMAYPDMLKSRQIRERILGRDFELVSGRRAPLQDLLGFSGGPETRLGKGLDYLNRKIRVAIDKETGVLEIVATLPEPELARSVAAAYVEELMRIEKKIHKDTSTDNKEFIQGRLQEAQGELRAAENALRAFQERNLRVGNDPQLHLEAARLAREFRIQEEIYLTLTRQLELAKIEVNRDNAGIQVIDPPQRPLARSSPILLKNLVLSAFLGFVVTSLLIVGIDWWVATRRCMRLMNLGTDPVLG